MSLHDQIIASVVDKLLIGFVVLIAGWWLNRLLEGIKYRLALQNEFSKLRDAKELDFLDRQLSQFYYPLYIRLHIDRAVWDRILDKKKGSGDVRGRVGEAIEKNVILPNHLKMVGIIESNIHLAESDGTAFSQMLQYVRHVSVYRALRESGIVDTDPLDLGEPWPSQFLEVIERTTGELQERYDKLATTHLDETRAALRS